ncbi:MAG: phosphoribosylformylglycinamidine synthase [Clostridiales bacterium]|jgi:phosphoribosylformylglycinamidine synthase|nr:phosphoribosylformylglycinamidine synthase [Clostridiales bacterium]
MKKIRRIFTEKKPGFDTAAASLLGSLRSRLNLNLTNLRVFARYDAEGDIGDADWARCVNQVFSEPAADAVYEALPEFSGFALTVKYLPGQYDQRADSAVQCVQAIMSGNSSPASGSPPPLTVETARVYVCEGAFTESEKEKIRHFFINPVDSFEAPPGVPETLQTLSPEPEPVANINGFTGMSDGEIRALHGEMGLAMRPEDLLFCREYFSAERRDPTFTEIKVIDTYWSDHCRHTTFTTALTEISFEDGPYKALFQDAYSRYLAAREEVYGPDAARPVTLMDIAVTGMKALRKKGLLNDLDESEEINACSIVIPVTTVKYDGGTVTEDWLLQFKNETHNHPTEIEPYGGAATCLGGAIRDPLSGRAYVYQALRVTGSGDPTAPIDETWQGKLPQQTITTQAAAGFSAYGNQIGLATGHVAEIYHSGYTAKRMEIGAVIGAVKRADVKRETPADGDIILLLGGRTGRDGCGGATGSSRGHTEASLTDSGPEVQKGNPTTERKLQRLFRNPEATALIRRCNDFGAGGVCVAVGELADGMDIDLDAVPKKYEGLNGTELAISESQERMAVVVSPGDAERFIALAGEENLETTRVAVVKDHGRIRMNWRGNIVLDISRAFLSSSGAEREARVRVPAYAHFRAETGTLKPITQTQSDESHPGQRVSRWLRNLKSLNVAAQKGLVERFDASIGAGTVLMPFCGKHRLTPAQAMAAKIPVTDGETDHVSLMSFGFDPGVTEESPFHGAAYAVAESLAKIVAAGGSYQNARLTFQEYFERLGNDPLRWQKPFLALLGAFTAQMAFGTPAIGGKDSMSGSYEDKDVPPTLVSFAVQTADLSEVISPELKAPGNALVWLRAKYGRNHMPDFEYLKKSFARVTELIHQKKIVSAYTVGAGGVAAALTKMALGNMVGAEISHGESDLYHPEYGSFLLEISAAPLNGGLLPGLDFAVLGKTTACPAITVNGVEIPLSRCREAWLSVFEPVFPTQWGKPGETVSVNVPLYEGSRAARFSAAPYRAAKPGVFIPVFPGSNCEYDTARAFTKAGAETDIFVIRNLTARDLEISVREMAKRIDEAQILMLIGGFSSGDEPDGSAKFITALLRNAAVAEAVHTLLYKRGGLALGICNGFQALVKSGLLPYGEIREMKPDSPTLTFNTIGRHVSDLVMTKTVSTLSPWLWKMSAGDVRLVPVSHGEGRFVASEGDLKRMIENHQIATRYVDFDGNPSMDIRFNPNGSALAIEGITSPDGRVFGKMGHSERAGAGLYKGFEMPADQKIFESGVAYFN